MTSFLKKSLRSKFGLKKSLTKVGVLSAGVVRLDALAAVHEAVVLGPEVVLQPGGRDVVETVGANLEKRRRARRRRNR